MKIKIKVKTILLLALSLVFIYLVIIPFASLEIARYYDNKSSDKASLFYESFLSKSFLWNDSKALYEYGSGLIGFEEKFQIHMGGPRWWRYQNPRRYGKGPRCPGATP